MNQSQTGPQRLSGNALKLLAALTMFLDHAGMLLFPRVTLLRILGRLSFPIYAFMIAEGCRYTKNKLRYFLSVFGLGVACQVVFYLFSRSLYLCVLITFSVSMVVIWALQWCREGLASEAASLLRKGLGVLALAAAVIGAWVLNRYAQIDYGFWGCMLGVFPALFPQPGDKGRLARVVVLGAGLTVLAADMGGIQWYALLALPVLGLYSGQRGRGELKYFFYIFYPAHLVLLQGVQMLLS